MTITLQEAIDFAQWLEPQLAALQAHVALTGSCLFKGSSTKDMDFVIYPHNAVHRENQLSPEALGEIIKELFPEAFDIVDNAYPSDRYIFRYVSHGRRIEFFIFK